MRTNLRINSERSYHFHDAIFCFVHVKVTLAKCISHLLQNQTLTTSFSRLRVSDTNCSSSLVGFGFWLNARSSAIRTFDSIDVLFFLRLPMASCELMELQYGFWFPIWLPVSWADTTWNSKVYKVNEKAMYEMVHVIDKRRNLNLTFFSQ